jgi:enhancing lycopene biosynthesis protein 2
MLRVGVVLSGCGFQDGAEIQEAVFTLLHLDQAGVETVCMAPNLLQKKVVNHLTGEDMNESRNVLVESARICRGNIKDIKDVDPASLDGLIFPGGFGAALNLSTYATDGLHFVVNPDVEKLILDTYSLEKPLGFICISPVIAAKVLGGSEILRHKPVKLTIGTDKDTAEAIHALNAVHEASVVDDVAYDLENKVVSTPAYMLGPGPRAVDKGIEKLVRQVLILAEAAKKSPQRLKAEIS